jgi:hypothetical protein
MQWNPHLMFLDLRFPFNLSDPNSIISSAEFPPVIIFLSLVLNQLLPKETLNGAFTVQDHAAKSMPT